MSQESKLTVGIFIFDQVEVLDFCGPFEVFSVARSFGDPDESHGLFQAVTIAEEDRIITCYGGLIITSAGISAGIDMSLHVVSRFYGEEVAAQTARDMEYEWSAHVR